MKKYIKILICGLFILSNTALFATDYYVDAARPNDNGAGTTLATAKRTLQAIVTNVALKGGDVVYVKGGTYTVAGTQAVLSITRSGSAALGYLVFKNFPGETPLIEFDGTNGIEVINGNDYIEINGFEVKGFKGATDTRTVAGAETQYANYATCATPTYNAIYAGNGIIVKDNDNNITTDNSNNIRILNCKVHDCGGGGIQVSGGDYITIEDNEVYRNAFYSFYANSGISIYQPYNFDATTGYKIVIQRNKSYLNDSKIKWTSGCKFSDGNGIIIDDTRNTQNTSAYGIYAGKILIANNLTAGNGGSGIHAYSSNNVDIVYNVSYQNGQRTGYDDGGIYGNATTNVRILNNIIIGITGKKVNTNFSNTSHTISYNSFNQGNAPTLTGTGIISGTNNLTSNPLFVSPSTDLSTADFRLGAASPAVNSALAFADVTTDFTGASRPQGAGPDQGAYEQAGVVPVELIYFKATPSVKSNLLTWATATEINTTHFDVERSSNGQDFEKITQVKAQGSRSTYQFLDALTPPSGVGGLYYRLKINDLDGKTTLSKIVNVASNGKSTVKIYPSVSSGILTIEHAQTVQIVNAMGQIVLSQTAVTPQLSLNIQHLTSGFYVVQGMDTEGGTFTEKIVKQ